jgi:biotin carboxylase
VPKLSRKAHVVVVDAYSGGRYLIPAFQALGYPVIHVQSAEPPSIFVADDERAARLADRHLRHTGAVEDLVEVLRAASTCLVLPGSEGGVLLADRLADLLDLPFRNPIELSTARRDKYEMQERLRGAGLAAVAQARVTDVAQLDAWLDQHGAYPVVLKPLRSAGTQGVAVCLDRDDAVAALAEIHATPDMFGNVNDAALCQEFLTGDEHVVNGVACAGQYRFTEGWRSAKVDNRGYRVYDTQYLSYHGDPIFDDITGYVIEVCRALGIVNGAFHAEVMRTPAGPVLIEVAARMAGGADPYVIETCLGHSQISELLAASLHPARYVAELATRPPAVLQRHAAYVYLIADYDGRVERPNLEAFLQVDGVLSVDYHYLPGDRQATTRDLLTAAGVVIVVRDDEIELESAVRRVRAVERAVYQAGVVPERA